MWCKGSGRIPVHQCPHGAADTRPLPFFFDYRKFGKWPDGGSRLKQPLKLCDAFSVLDFYFNKYESLMAKEAEAKAKRGR